MEKKQSESILELKLIEALESKVFKHVEKNNYDQLKENLRNQLFTHNKSRLNNKPLTDREFNQKLLIIERENVFKSAVDQRQLHLINQDNGETVYVELINKADWCKNEKLFRS
jgi:type I restriction enzyme, R subunit